MPALSVTPQPLRDYSVSKALGTAFSYFGYRFEAPWSGSFTTQGLPKNNDKTGMILIKFKSGQNVLFIVPSDQNGLLAELAQDPNYHSARAIFGSLTDASPYDQYSVLLNTTPSTIRPFGPRADAVREMMLLTIKGIAPPGDLESGAFSFQLPGKRGFQIGDPRTSRRSVALEVLDMRGRWIEIICGNSRDGARVTQQELNRILSTLQTVPVNSGTPEQNATPDHGLGVKVRRETDRAARRARGGL